MQAGTPILIPLAAGKHPVSENATYARRITRYKVRKGDTVETVAENFGVSAQMLRRWNGLHGDSLHGRKVLALHLPVTPNSEVAASKSAVRSRKTSPAVSARSSAAKPAKSSDSDAETNAGGPAGGAVLHHTVRSGETLYSIATTYKTTVAALKRSNGNVAVLRPGMILVVQTAR